MPRYAQCCTRWLHFIVAPTQLMVKWAQLVLYEVGCGLAHGVKRGQSYGCRWYECVNGP